MDWTTTGCVGGAFQPCDLPELLYGAADTLRVIDNPVVDSTTQKRAEGLEQRF
jgi:hypothetical protein